MLTHTCIKGGNISSCIIAFFNCAILQFCNSILGALLKSELFGYRKGTFGEAKKGQTLAFCETARGTLFLDGNR